MNPKTRHKLILKIDFKYGKLLKYLAFLELKRFYAVPLEVDDLYNCFMYEIPQIIPKIGTPENAKFVNTLKLFARRFYFRKCRQYVAQKYQILNQSTEIVDWRGQNHPKTTTIIDFTLLNYEERVIYKSLIYERNIAKSVGQKLGISLSSAALKIKRFKLKFRQMILNS